jgi:hypothetical protein
LEFSEPVGVSLASGTLSASIDMVADLMKQNVIEKEQSEAGLIKLHPEASPWNWNKLHSHLRVPLSDARLWQITHQSMEMGLRNCTEIDAIVAVHAIVGCLQTSLRCRSSQEDYLLEVGEVFVRHQLQDNAKIVG